MSMHYFYFNGTPCECDYLEREWHESIHGIIVEDTPYVNGRRHGIKKSFYKYSPKQPFLEVPFVNDSATGMQRAYDDEGLWRTTPLVDGEYHGKSKFYKSSGELNEEIVYVHNTAMKPGGYRHQLNCCPMENYV